MHLYKLYVLNHNQANMAPEYSNNCIILLRSSKYRVAVNA